MLLHEKLAVEDNCTIFSSCLTKLCHETSATVTKDDPCHLALARRASHHRPAESLTLNLDGRYNTATTKQQTDHLTKHRSATHDIYTGSCCEHRGDTNEGGAKTSSRLEGLIIEKPPQYGTINVSETRHIVQLS
jgi:hypothetical protein